MRDTEQRPAKFRKLDATQAGVSTASSLGPNASDASDSDPVINQAQQQTHLNNESPRADLGGPTESEKPLSKNQQKKLRRQQQWEDSRDYRKAKRKEKIQQKKAQKAAVKASSDGASNSIDERDVLQNELHVEVLRSFEPAQNTKPTSRPFQLPLTLVLDCSFESFMTEKELISLGSQITRCYSENRTTRFKSHLVISSWGGKLKERFETVLNNHHLGWKGTRFCDEGWVEAAKIMTDVMKSKGGGTLAGALAGPGLISQNPSSEMHVTSDLEGAEAMALGPLKGSANEASDAEAAKDSVADADARSIQVETSIVYLTADSPNTITTLSPYTTYVIGGIVDKNRHKGLCYKQACEAARSPVPNATADDSQINTPSKDLPSESDSQVSITTAKLPIGEYMTMRSRTVLTVNHVVEIMLRWLVSNDWGEAFLHVIPKRKGGKLKEGDTTVDGVDGGEPEEEGHKEEGRPLKRKRGDDIVAEMNGIREKDVSKDEDCAPDMVGEKRIDISPACTLVANESDSKSEESKM